MKKKVKMVAGLVARHDPLKEDRDAMKLLTTGIKGRRGNKSKAKAKAIVRRQMERDRLISQQILIAAER